MSEQLTTPIHSKERVKEYYKKQQRSYNMKVSTVRKTIEKVLELIGRNRYS